MAIFNSYGKLPEGSSNHISSCFFQAFPRKRLIATLRNMLSSHHRKPPDLHCSGSMKEKKCAPDIETISMPLKEYMFSLTISPTFLEMSRLSSISPCFSFMYLHLLDPGDLPLIFPTNNRSRRPRCKYSRSPRFS